jgi:hypothetical protein
MVSVLTSIAVDRGFESQSGQTNDYKIDICCFSAMHTALRWKSNFYVQDFTFRVSWSLFEYQ